MNGNESVQSVAFQAPLFVSPPPQLELPTHILTHPFDDVSPVGSKSEPVWPQFVNGIEFTKIKLVLMKVYREVLVENILEYFSHNTIFADCSYLFIWASIGWYDNFISTYGINF